LAARLVADGHDVLVLGRTPSQIRGTRYEWFDVDRPGEQIQQHLRYLLVAEGEGFEGEARELTLSGKYAGALSWRRFWFATRRGAPDVAVLSAGMGAYMRQDQWHDDSWVDSKGKRHAGINTVMRTNVLSKMWIANELIRGMRRRRSGKIVLIGSRVAARGDHALEAYAASQAALRGYVLSASRHPAKRGVIVGLIEPGWANTGMTADLAEWKRRAIERAYGEMMSADDCAAWIDTHIEIIQPGEIAEIGK
jgi:NAD(P)-dependent dehydrogenase (short-subunit alcohol dehydrogenase family)